MVASRQKRHRWILGLTLFGLLCANAQTAAPPAPSARAPITVSIGDQSQPQVTVSISGESETQPASSRYAYRSLHISVPLADTNGLEAVILSPPGVGAHPLAIINHGTPRKPDQRATMNPSSVLPMAIEFARRGWTTVILMRRGYGRSGGKFAETIGSCDHPDYKHAAAEAGRDTRAAIGYLSNLAEVDSGHVLIVGVSSGGFATIALAANPPPGVVAGISFAGGNGSMADGEVCRPEALVEAFGSYGMKSRLPMLWVYSENDHYFSPEVANHFYEAFTKGGGHAEFRRVASFQEDGHRLFSFHGIPVWTRYVDEFLENHKLALRSELLPPPPLPNVPPPPELSPAWQGAFHYYLAAPTVKAFAVSSDGFFGYRFGESTAEEAQRKAVHNCDQQTAKHACRVAFLNDRPIK